MWPIVATVKIYHSKHYLAFTPDISITVGSLVQCGITSFLVFLAERLVPGDGMSKAIRSSGRAQAPHLLRKAHGR